MSRLVEEMSGSEALSSLALERQALCRCNQRAAIPFLGVDLSAWHKWLGREKHPRLFCARSAVCWSGLLALGEEEADD